MCLCAKWSFRIAGKEKRGALGQLGNKKIEHGDLAWGRDLKRDFEAVSTLE